MPKIVPKKNAPGVDFCSSSYYSYIIHSDLGCYTRLTNINQGKDIEVYSLHNSCRGGDHHLADDNGLFYIIKGNQYRCVSNINTDKDAGVHCLHPNCCGGDHYLSTAGKFYIIFQGRGTYRQVSNLTTDEDAFECNLHPCCKVGLYYCAMKSYYFFLKPQDKWGTELMSCTDLHEYSDAERYSIHADVVNFLPGGLAITQGSSFGGWETIKTISNESSLPLKWEKKITKKVGYKKKEMSSTEHKWKVNICASYQAGALTEALAKFQFSLSAEYGGKYVNTEEEEWSEATETEESISVMLKPNTKMYIYQYHLGFGKEAVLFCRDMKLTEDSTPPTEDPLQTSKLVMRKAGSTKELQGFGSPWWHFAILRLIKIIRVYKL